MAVRRLWLVAASALVVVGAIEAFSFLALRVVSGEWVGLAGLAALRDARASGAIGGVTPEDASERVERGVQRALHPFLGWVVDADAPQRMRLFAAHPQALAYGFPDNAHPLFYAPDPERLVVAVLGGSVAASFVRNAGPARLDALAASPRFAGREPVILSLALAGFKQPQQLMTLSWLLALGAHFDVVIELDGYNELMASVENAEARGVFSAYPKRWYERVADLDAGLRLAVGELAFVEQLRRAAARRFSAAPLRWSLLAGLVWELFDRSLETRMALAQQRILAGDRAKSFQVRGPGESYDSTEQLLDAVAALWRRSSLQMQRLATAHGAEYHHFLQPNQYVEGSKRFTDAERRKALRPGTRRAEIVQLGYPRLQREGALLRERGVDFRDLTPVFHDVEGAIYIDICCHVNRIGNRLLAGEIARALDEAER